MEDREYYLEEKKYRLSRISAMISALIPIVLVFLTFSVQSVITEREAQYEREAQILQEKQSLYSTIGEYLNTIYIYTIDVGRFRQYTPDDIIDLKRSSDAL